MVINKKVLYTSFVRRVQRKSILNMTEIFNKKEYIKKRQKEIEALGIKVLRYTNNDVIQNIEGVLYDIIATTPHSPPSQGGDEKKVTKMRTFRPSFLPGQAVCQSDIILAGTGTRRG